MFGPDICGTTKRVHVIFNYNSKNLLLKKEIKCETDQLTHLYRLHLYSNASYSVSIDNEVKQFGNLEDDWDFFEPKLIKDPNSKKPSDWDDKEKIPDPEDVKPEGYDDIPKQIPDVNAQKPDDWDEEEDGSWEAPMVPNPNYKGEWKPKLIKNPLYKGKWNHPMISNPNYIYDNNLPIRCLKCNLIGFELWQVKSGTVFSDILITDDLIKANEYGKFFDEYIKIEKEKYDEIEKEKRNNDKINRDNNKNNNNNDVHIENGGDENDEDGYGDHDEF